MYIQTYAQNLFCSGVRVYANNMYTKSYGEQWSTARRGGRGVCLFEPVQRARVAATTTTQTGNLEKTKTKTHRKKNRPSTRDANPKRLTDARRGGDSETRCVRIFFLLFLAFTDYIRKKK